MQSNKAHGATRVLGAYLQVWKEKVGVGVCLFISEGVTALAKRGKTCKGRKKDAFPVGLGKRIVN